MALDVLSGSPFSSLMLCLHVHPSKGSGKMFVSLSQFHAVVAGGQEAG